MEAYFSIAATERDTGLSKDVLRVWERRYGFPVPARDGHGERSYPAEQVARLRIIKRLLDQGHRPGRLVATSPAELDALAGRLSAFPAARGLDKRSGEKSRPSDAATTDPFAPVDRADRDGGVTGDGERPATRAPRRAGGGDAGTGAQGWTEGVDGDLAPLLERVRRHDAAGLQQAMQQRMARQGLLGFVQDTVAPLTAWVGDAWAHGDLGIFEEHLFTESIYRLMRQAIAGLPPATEERPRVLLTTVPDEQHGLGLLMVEAMLALEGAHCVPLGTRMPVTEIRRACEAHHADVIALSFSQAFPRRDAPAVLRQLCELLPARIDVWAGGGGVDRLARSRERVPGVRLLGPLEDVARAVRDWRATAR